MPRVRPLLACLVLSVALAGCGGTAESQTETAETEGIYRVINGLKYQVQLSRYMNPQDVEDRQFFVGLPPGTTPPTGDETWFGVWLRVQNETDEALQSVTDVEIVDTEENVYEPIAIDAEENPFVYEPQVVPPGIVIPRPDTAAGQGPIQGELILFKVTNESLQNRPLEFRFSNGEGTEVGSYDLDV